MHKYRQNDKFDNNANLKTAPLQKFDNNGNKLKVTLNKDSLFVADKDQLVPVTSIKALDSLVKRLPNPESLIIDFESINADAEKMRAIESVLKQYNCHIRKHAISFNKQ